MEERCVVITEQKKHFWFENKEGPVFIKRNLTPSEYVHTCAGQLVIPYLCLERMKNEVAAIRYVQSLDIHISTPNIRCAFEDHGRYYIVTDIVPGVRLKELPEDKKAPVIEELKGYVAQCTQSSYGRLSGRHDCTLSRWEGCTSRSSSEAARSHYPSGQQNVIVDEKTLKINAILDWEYAGFYPPEFDRAFYLRPGPSVALNIKSFFVKYSRS
jgi:hypothetical protein